MKLFKPDEERFTLDFNIMLKIVLLNSLGFFFISSWIPVITRTNMGATSIQFSIFIELSLIPLYLVVVYLLLPSLVEIYEKKKRE